MLVLAYISSAAALGLSSLAIVYLTTRLAKYLDTQITDKTEATKIKTLVLLSIFSTNLFGVVISFHLLVTISGLNETAVNIMILASTFVISIGVVKALFTAPTSMKRLG